MIDIKRHQNYQVIILAATKAYRVLLLLVRGLSISLFLEDEFVIGVDGSSYGDESENNDGDLYVRINRYNISNT